MRFPPIAVTLFALFGCSDGSFGLTPKHQVYETVLHEAVNDASTPVLIADRTSCGRAKPADLEWLNRELDLWQDPPRALISQLLSGCHSSESLNWSPIMVNGVFIGAPTDGDGVAFWQQVRDHGAHSYHVLSDVALNSAQDEAVLVYGFRCQALCGASDRLLHLRKADRQWKLVNSFLFWIS